MSNRENAIKGLYCIPIYLCLLGIILFVDQASFAWIGQSAKYFLLPLLILFFYLNTNIDSRFEKRIFYGIILFAIGTSMEIIANFLGAYTIHIVLILMIFAYYNYAKALISITSVRSSLLYQKKALAVALLVLALAAGGLFIWHAVNDLNTTMLVPLLCVWIASFFFLMACINLYGQLVSAHLTMIWVSCLLLMLYNCHTALNINNNISIFESDLAFSFYLGQLLFIWAAVRSSIQFKNDDHSGISDVLKTVIEK